MNTTTTKNILLATTLFITGVLSGCAPGLGERVEVTALPTIPTDNIPSTMPLGLVKINVSKFSDERTVKDSIKVNDREVEVDGDLGTVVQSGVIEALKGEGATLCLFDCLSLNGEISDWSMKINPQFPSTKVDAKAKIKISLVTKEGKTVLTRIYSGTTKAEHPLYDEERLLNTFGDAMNEAITSALQDGEMTQALNRYSN